MRFIVRSSSIFECCKLIIRVWKVSEIFQNKEPHAPKQSKDVLNQINQVLGLMLGIVIPKKKRLKKR